ncbi:HNH endonuclease [Gaetbulibacter sp. PBL-D1]|uniref:HNH endonuclease n=1 Tax=Gaetbulibacter sp. PBL-D1 TaxID=3422594 RepID=UPI003D2EB472
MTTCFKCNSKSVKLKRDYNHWDVFDCLNCGYWTYKISKQCCRNIDEVVTVHRQANRIFIWYQCLNCGGSSNRNKPLSKKYDNLIEDEFSEDRFEEFKESKENEHDELIRLKEIFKLKNSKRYKYHNYLLSEKWKIKKDKVLLRDNYTCKNCNSNIDLEIHHLHYENVFNENLDDLITVCSECHKKLHEKI